MTVAARTALARREAAGPRVPHTLDTGAGLTSRAIMHQGSGHCALDVQGEASGFRTHRRGRRRWAGGGDPRLRLGHPQQRAHRAPAVLEEAALLGEGDGLVEAGARAEVVTELVVRRAEAGSGAWRSQTPAGDRSAV